MANPIASALIKQLNPNFVAPKRPFLRLSYVDAIKWLVERGIKRPDEDAEGNVIKDEQGNPVMVDHVLGDDIAEAAERQMTDILAQPVFLYGFPKELKAFYMKAMPGTGEGGLVYTESCDLLMPNVGEIVGGSMRISDIDELLAGYKRVGIDAAPYYWFTDQRKYGTCEHGGCGLGVEVSLLYICCSKYVLSALFFQRFLAWLANRHTVRECCLYPRLACFCSIYISGIDHYLKMAWPCNSLNKGNLKYLLSNYVQVSLMF